MAKYQWNDSRLQKKAQRYDWLMLVCCVSDLGLYLMKVSSLMFLLPLAGAVVCYVMSWRVRSEDAKLGGRDKRS